MWTTCFRKIGRLNFHNGKNIPVSTTYQNRDPLTISIGFNSCIRYKSSKPEAKKDFYKVLGVTKHATKDEIKRNFRELAKKYHPDLNKEATAESKFKEVSEAHEILSDDHKRKMYDSYGHDGVDPDFEEGGFGGFGGFHDMPTEFIDLSDIFGHSKSSRKKKGGSNWEEEIAMEELLMMMQGMSGMGGGFDMGINNSGRGKKSKKGNRYSADEVEFMSFMSEVDPFFNSGGSGPKKGKKTGPGGRAKKPKKY